MICLEGPVVLERGNAIVRILVIHLRVVQKLGICVDRLLLLRVANAE